MKLEVKIGAIVFVLGLGLALLSAYPLPLHAGPTGSDILNGLVSSRIAVSTLRQSTLYLGLGTMVIGLAVMLGSLLVGLLSPRQG